MHRAAQLAANLRPDGTWPDLEAVDPFTPGSLGVPEHLRRTRLLAQASHEGSGPEDPLARALDYWLAHDFRADDWRQNQLEVPHLVGSVALRLANGLSAGARGKVMEIMARPRWHHWQPSIGWIEWKGTTLLRVAYNTVLCGCLDDTPARFAEAFARGFGALRLAAEGEEGIQPDMIYRGSDTASAADSGGISFVIHCAQLITMAHGTPWQAPAEAVKLLAAFLLDGQQWLMCNGTWDPNFPQKNAAPGATDLRELADAVDRLAQLGDIPSRAELAAFARRLAEHGGALSGHRYFWRSGFSVHQRPAYYASVCLPLETAGRLDAARPRIGTTCVMRSGGEHADLTLTTTDGLPGTTFLRTGVASGDAVAGETLPFTGGVSEGDYGLAAMQTARSGYCATKAWFYFDQSFVCLGAGIAATGSNQPVFTSINQCRLNGPVVAAADRAQARPLTPGMEHALPMIRRVAHDGITYHFVKPSRVAVQTGARVDRKPEDAVSPERFALFLNHGLNPNDESFGVIVLPTGDDAAAKTRIDEEVAQIEVLANTSALQAVRHRGLRLVQAVFWRAGVVAMPEGGGRVAANQPCVLICRDTPSTGKRVTVANLRSEAATVHVEYAGKCIAFELPGGPGARRGISRSL